MSSFYPYVDDRRAWNGANLPAKESLAHTLPRAATDQLMRTARVLASKGLPFSAFGREHFAEPDLVEALQAPFREVRNGLGFAIIRGLPVEGAPLDVVKLAYWGLGALLGRGQSQSNLGDLIGEVADVTNVDPHARGYRSAKELRLHTDICDMIALLSVRAARTGGENSVASAFAVHNLFLAERPDLLGPLYDGYHNHRRGEEAPDEDPITPHRVPVFSVAHGALSIRYVRPYITHGLKAKGEAYPELIEALDALEGFAERVKFTFRLDPGETLLLNNLTTLHARSEFEDWPQPDRKRLLLRLWLNADGFRQKNPNIHLYGDGDGIPFVAGRTSSYAGFD
jgi:alpha-ketoglutarate-dependent taurine dioxygenase